MRLRWHTIYLSFLITFEPTNWVHQVKRGSVEGRMWITPHKKRTWLNIYRVVRRSSFCYLYSLISNSFTVLMWRQTDEPTFCIQHFFCPWGYQTAGQMRTGRWCSPVSAETGSRIRNVAQRHSWDWINVTETKCNLSSFQVDVLQVAVVEVQVAAVTLLISEIHHV